MEVSRIKTPATIEELIALLMDENVQEFNRQRPEEEIDLSGADLEGLDLSGVDLSGANLREMSLCDTNLSGASLKEADLFGVDLFDSTLEGVDFRDVDTLFSSNLWGARGLSEEQKLVILDQLKKSW